MDIEKIYKKLSKQARKNGYYLIPKSFYEELFNTIEGLRMRNKSLMGSRDRWKKRYWDVVRESKSKG